MRPMKTLILTNVTIENNGQLIALFTRSQKTLTTFQYDTKTCCSLLSEISTIRIIYENLSVLQNLETLKLMEGNSLCDHANLELPSKLKSLTIYSAKHKFYNELLRTLKRIIVKNLTLEIRECIHNKSIVPKDLEKAKQKYLSDIRAHQENFTLKMITQTKITDLN